MKKILLIGTGGTISCVPSEGGFVPGLDAKANIYLSVQTAVSEATCLYLYC